MWFVLQVDLPFEIATAVPRHLRQIDIPNLVITDCLFVMSYYPFVFKRSQTRESQFEYISVGLNS